MLLFATYIPKSGSPEHHAPSHSLKIQFPIYFKSNHMFCGSRIYFFPWLGEIRGNWITLEVSDGETVRNHCKEEMFYHPKQIAQFCSYHSKVLIVFLKLFLCVWQLCSLNFKGFFCQTTNLWSWSISSSVRLLDQWHIDCEPHLSVSFFKWSVKSWLRRPVGGLKFVSISDVFFSLPIKCKLLMWFFSFFHFFLVQL